MPTTDEVPSAKQSKSGRILVLRGGALGDFILTLPVLAALRRAFPDTQLEVMAYPQFAELAVAGGFVDGARRIEARALAGFFGRGGDLDFELSTYFAQVHLLISYLYDPDLIFRTNIARISKTQFVQGPHRPDEPSSQHATLQLLKPLEQLAIFDADPVPRLALPKPDLIPGAWLALHPGSGSEKKNWPEAAWAELLQRLIQRTPFQLCLIGGEAEGDRLERLASQLPSARYELWRSQPLSSLARRLASCAAFIGHDSGIGHLAAAVGLPGLTLWGPSNATVWRPSSTRFDLITAGDDLARLTLDQVWQRLEPAFDSWMRSAHTQCASPTA